MSQSKELAVVTNSKDLSEKLGKSHKQIIDLIAILIRDGEGTSIPSWFTESTYKTKQNKVLPCYDICKDGVMLVCMSIRGRKGIEQRLKVMNEFNKMYSELF